MTRFLLSLFVCAFATVAFAQDDNTHVTLHAGDVPIETQLSDEQKQAVTHLTITGKLLDEDYAYMRSTLLDKLEELNLRKADIDTIPAKALMHGENDYSYNQRQLRIILPEKLRHLSNRCFYMPNTVLQFEVTGWFPTLDCEVFYIGDTGWNHASHWDHDSGKYLGMREICVVSDDNPHCTYIEYCGVFSAELDTLYFGSMDTFTYLNPLMTNGEEAFFPSNTRVIADHAFEGHFIEAGVAVIQSSIEHIGDYAFLNARYPIGTCGYCTYFYIDNYSYTPQTIGKDAFGDIYWWWGDDKPDTSYIIARVYCEVKKAYEKAEGWKDLRILCHGMTSIDNPVTDENNTKIALTADGLQITAVKTIKSVALATLAGQALWCKQVDSTETLVPLKDIKNTVYVLTLTFADGTQETIKL